MKKSSKKKSRPMPKSIPRPIPINELKSGGGWAEGQLELLKRVFNGMEVVDATFSLALHLKNEDYIGAIPNSLTDCVFAKTSKRMHDSGAMLFCKSIAYVDLEGEDGVRRVHRFVIGAKMKRSLLLFDKSGGTERTEDGTYMLLAPSKTATLNHQLLYDREVRAKIPEYKKKKIAREKVRRALIRSTGRPVKTKTRAGVPSVIGIIRSGAGLVQTKIIRS
jgi:hypothetical protein